MSQVVGGGLSARAELCRREVSGRKSCLLSSGLRPSELHEDPALNLSSCVPNLHIVMWPGRWRRVALVSTFGVVSF